MKKRLYVDFHVLQTVPPSCINRDDTGSPKTAMYGGVLRARVSSQAWKHAMRKDFAENTPLDVGKRTKKAAELVKKQILALDSELDADKLAKKALENTGIKSDDKGTKALFFMSTAQAKALAALAVAGSTDKKEYQKALRAAPSMDMALFGRMVADDPSLKYNAAARGLDLEGLRVGIASSIGHMLGKLFTSPALGTLLLTGGDTLLQCMNCVGIKELEPVCEVEKGVVLARFTYRGCTRYVITKSGGFGHEKLLLDLADRIAAEQT